MPRKVPIRNVEFEHHDDYFVRFQADTMIMVTPMGNPSDKCTKWEGFLHDKDEAATILDHVESYSKEAVVAIAVSRDWVK